MIQTDCATESWPTCSCIRCSFEITGSLAFVYLSWATIAILWALSHLSSSRLVGCTTTPLRKRSPYWGSPGNYSNPCGLQAQAALSFYYVGMQYSWATEWRSGNDELSEHVTYYMQTVMHALCRHVPKSGLQTDTNVLRVGTCSYFLQKKRSACVLLWIVCVRRQKSKLQAMAVWP